MTTVELKRKLIRKINSMQNELLLEEMLRLAGSGDKSDLYILSDEQVDAIEQSQEQYRKGEFLSNEDSDKEIDEWLNR